VTVEARILVADALRRIPAPCCRKLHVVDPSLRVAVSCCGKRWMPRREVVGISLVELTPRGAA